MDFKGYNEQRKKVKNLANRKKQIEEDLDKLIDSNDIPGWTKKRAEFHEVNHKLQAEKQYLKPLKNTHIIETSIPYQR